LSAFDMKLNVGRTAIASPPPEMVKNGEAENALDVILTVVSILPVAGQGGQPMVMPLGNVKFGLTRDQAVEFFKTGLETAEELPPESNLVIANDLKAAEQFGTDLGKFRDGPQS
jgi:hypothetical protein